MLSHSLIPFSDIPKYNIEIFTHAILRYSLMQYWDIHSYQVEISLNTIFRYSLMPFWDIHVQYFPNKRSTVFSYYWTMQLKSFTKTSLLFMFSWILWWVIIIIWDIYKHVQYNAIPDCYNRWFIELVLWVVNEQVQILPAFHGTIYRLSILLTACYVINSDMYTTWNHA